jgi:hypothetical protein
MYKLSDQQIDFITADIKQRGIEMEGLQQSLLDHICCIIEQDFTEGGDFEQFYRQTIHTFYKNELREIENETIYLLTIKKQPVMKKVTIISSAVSAFLLVASVTFKLYHLTGANLLLFTSLTTTTLVTFPVGLIYIAKYKTENRAIYLLGHLAVFLFFFGLTFKTLHYPGAMVISTVAAGMVGLFIILFARHLYRLEVSA